VTDLMIHPHNRHSVFARQRFEDLRFRIDWTHVYENVFPQAVPDTSRITALTQLVKNLSVHFQQARQHGNLSTTTL
jgi:hypothetical protein